MSEEIPIANSPLSAEEQSVVAKLTDTNLKIIDGEILASSSNRWLKVARVVMWTEKALSDQLPGSVLYFLFSAANSSSEEGRLESQGNLEYMRFSEVRLRAWPSHRTGALML